MKSECFTIGVFNSTEEEFFEKLTSYRVDTFCDIRQRRGVRGAKYAFVNSKKLQQRLKELNISYEYLPGLAPSTKIRALQKEKDQEEDITNKKRLNLGEAFVNEYKSSILKPFNFEELLGYFEKNNRKRVVFFCVEEHPEACHRALVTQFLNEHYNCPITHL
ncbi:MAG: DUF488 domain-containing protein [Verrucomicrobia bacterium]|nr:DUF488 domain-containing protein [Prolixibacteraceae bacterium]